MEVVVSQGEVELKVDVLPPFVLVSGDPRQRRWKDTPSDHDITFLVRNFFVDRRNRNPVSREQ